MKLRFFSDSCTSPSVQLEEFFYIISLDYMTTTQTSETNISSLPIIVATLRTIAQTSEAEARRDSIIANIDALLLGNPSNSLLRKLR